MENNKQSSISIFYSIKVFSILSFLFGLLFCAFVFSPFEEKVKVAGAVVFMFSLLVFLFVMYDSVKILTKRLEEKEKALATLEGLIDDEIFCSIDEASMNSISHSMLELYILDETLYVPDFPKNILSIICRHSDMYVIFRNVIVSKMESVTLDLCSELAKGNKQNNFIVNAEIVRRRRVEDLLQELDVIDIAQNGTEHHLAKINTSKQDIIVPDYKDIGATEPPESTETIIL